MRKIKMPSSERPMKWNLQLLQDSGMVATCEPIAKLDFCPFGSLTDCVEREEANLISEIDCWPPREGERERARPPTFGRDRQRRHERDAWSDFSFVIQCTSGDMTQLHGSLDFGPSRQEIWNHIPKSSSKIMFSSSVNLCIFLLTTASLIWSSLLPIPIPLPLLSPTAAVTGRLRGRRMHK